MSDFFSPVRVQLNFTLFTGRPSLSEGGWVSMQNFWMRGKDGGDAQKASNAANTARSPYVVFSHVVNKLAGLSVWTLIVLALLEFENLWGPGTK